MNQRVLAIGDIHGCHAALTALLDAVRPTATDQVIFLGDYIDRGPASRQVIDTLLDLSKQCATVFLRGNHEIMLLGSRDESYKLHLWQSYGGWEMLGSYGADTLKNWDTFIPATHWNFFETTKLYYENENHIFVHGCVDGKLAMQEQPEWILCWEFFDRISPHHSGKRVVCGHTPQRSGQINDVGFVVCIDTGAVYGGWLTCLDVNTNKYWQANEKGEVREETLNRSVSQ